MKELRVIIAGSRGFCDYLKLKENTTRIITSIVATRPDDIGNIRVISGTARGADRLGERVAKECQYELSRFPADWNKFGKSAGYIRNAEMAKFAISDESFGVLIAFWDGSSRGTKHMINLAKEYKLAVYVVDC